MKQLSNWVQKKKHILPKLSVRMNISQPTSKKYSNPLSSLCTKNIAPLRNLIKISLYFRYIFNRYYVREEDEFENEYIEGR